MTPDKPYKRINFFNGFQTDEKDWQAVENYHIGKRRLHNTTLHSVGVVHGLAVKPAKNGTYFTVTPGIAIDGKGNELCLIKPSVPIKLDKEKYQDGGTVYIGIQFDEKPTTEREVFGSMESATKYAFFEEGVAVFDTLGKPDNEELIELARICLSDDWTKVSPARHPAYPNPDEIDTRYVLKAGSMHHICISGWETVTEADEKSIRIERINYSESDQSAHRFYLASVHPKEADKGPVSWRISSEIKDDHIEYSLIIKNESKEGQKVDYQVCRVF